MPIKKCPECQFEQHYAHLGIDSHAPDCYKPVVSKNDDDKVESPEQKVCDHDMEYPTAVAVIGGICRKCGFSTIL